MPPYSRLSFTVSTDTKSRRDMPCWLCCFLWDVSRPACCLGTGWCLLLLEICPGPGLAAALLAAGKAGCDRACASAATAVWMLSHPGAAGSVVGGGRGWPGACGAVGSCHAVAICTGLVPLGGHAAGFRYWQRQRGISAAVADGNSGLLASNRTADGTGHGTSLSTPSILVRGLFS